MCSHDPDGFAAREPSAKKVHREPLVLGLGTVAVFTVETVPYLRYDTVPCGRIHALVRHGDGTVLTRIDRKNTAVNGQYGFPHS